MAQKEREMSEEGPDVDVDDVQDETSTAVKRKADIDEIEVDLAAPEPPSKRAKRALKKGKALPAKSGSDNNNDDDLQEGEDKAAKEGKKRSEWSVWIGNLPFNVSAADIKNWLVTNSGGTLQPEAVTRVNVPKSKDPTRAKDAKPQNKGFAYVDFADQGGQVAAMALSESDLQGRKLLIKNATSFEGRPKKEAAAAAEPQSADQVAEFKKQQDASRKVFVGNMSFKTTEDDVRRNFEKCGEIDWVKIATFEDTGKCKGYGWVKFREPESAAWAVKGFVKIKEEVETAEDFDEDATPAAEEGGGGEDRQRQYKTRKWWVNRLMGRELKLELAEDDQTRYKKRFRGGGRDKAEGGKREGKREGKGRFSNKGKDQDGQDGGAPIVEVPTRNDAPLKESTDISVAKLTGAMVKPTGSKVTFD